MMPEAMLPAIPSADEMADAESWSACADCAGRGHRTVDRRGMKARLVRTLRRDETEAAHQLDARDDADEQPVATKLFALAGGEHGGDDHGAGMHRTALEGIVEVFTVGGRAIHEGGAVRIEAAGVAERGCTPRFVQPTRALR
jgi:hypothetical protein